MEFLTAAREPRSAKWRFRSFWLVCGKPRKDTVPIGDPLFLRAPE